MSAGKGFIIFIRLQHPMDKKVERDLSQKELLPGRNALSFGWGLTNVDLKG